MQSAKRKMQSVKCRVCDAIFIPLPSPAVTPSPRRGKANLGSTLEGGILKESDKLQLLSVYNNRFNTYNTAK